MFNTERITHSSIEGQFSPFPNGVSYPSQIEVNNTLEAQKKIEVEKLSDDIVKNLIGLDQWRRATRKDYVIDMYIYQPKPEELEPIPEDEAIPKLVEHINKIDEIGGPGLNSLPVEWQLIRANLVALATYLQEDDLYQKRNNGESVPPKMDYREYIQRVDGFEPRLIPYNVLHNNRREMLELARAAGVGPFDSSDDRSVKNALREHQEQVKVRSSQKFEEAFMNFYYQHREKLSQILGSDLMEIDVKLKKVEKPRMFWRMNEVILPGEEFVEYNFADRHRSYYNSGTEEMYSIHEPAHIQLAHKLRGRIESGEVDKAAGLLIIPGPACWQLEGLAQTLGNLASLDIQPMGRYAIATYRLEKRAQSNFLYEIEVNGMGLEQAVSDMGTFTPLFNREERRRLLRDGTRKPWERGYMLIYGISDDDFMKFNERAGTDAMVNIFLPEWFNKIGTRNQIMRPKDINYERYLWRGRSSE